MNCVDRMLITAIVIAMFAVLPAAFVARALDTSESAQVTAMACPAEDSAIWWDALQCGDHNGRTPVFSLPSH